MFISDAYVRDHLLIQFMLENYAPISFSEQGNKFVEDIYRKWEDWLHEMEERHDKRS